MHDTTHTHHVWIPTHCVHISKQYNATLPSSRRSKQRNDRLRSLTCTSGPGASNHTQHVSPAPTANAHHDTGRHHYWLYAYLQHAKVWLANALHVLPDDTLAVLEVVHTLSAVAVAHSFPQHLGLFNRHELLAGELFLCLQTRWSLQTVPDDVAVLIALKVGHLAKVPVHTQCLHTFGSHGLREQAEPHTRVNTHATRRPQSPALVCKHSKAPQQTHYALSAAHSGARAWLC